MQYDVYANFNKASRERFPFLLDVQAGLMEGLETRMIVPLAPRHQFERQALTRVMPILTVNSVEYVAVMPRMAGVAKRELGAAVVNLSHARPELVSAIDLLFTGV